MKISSSNTTLLALAAGLLLTACGGGPTDLSSGNVRFVMSAASDVAPAVTLQGAVVDGGSAPALSGKKDHDDHHDRDPRLPRFETANVTLSSLLARNYDGVLVDVAMELPTTVDIMRMDRGSEVTLPDGDLPAGSYDQIVIVMTAFQGVTEDGTTITIEPPGGGWTAVIPVCPFDVGEDDTAVVGLKLAVRRSFSWKDGRVQFRPTFECEEPEVTPVEG
jgi:hypothetical protein